MCVTPCETEAYQCLDKNDPHDLVSRVIKCEAEVVPKYETTEPGCCNLIAQHAESGKKACKCEKKAGVQKGEAKVTEPVHFLTEADARAQITRACTVACDGSIVENPIRGPSSMCVTPCEAEAYQCLDKNDPHDLVSRVKKCEAEVVPKYVTTEPGCCNLIARAKVDTKKVCKCETKIVSSKVEAKKPEDQVGFLTEADARARVTRACTIACDGSIIENPIRGPSSMCVTPCETEAYRCLDKNKPHDLVSRVKKCEAEVVPKYKTTEPGCCNFIAGTKSEKKDCKCNKDGKIEK